MTRFILISILLSTGFANASSNIGCLKTLKQGAPPDLDLDGAKMVLETRHKNQGADDALPNSRLMIFRLAPNKMLVISEVAQGETFDAREDINVCESNQNRRGLDVDSFQVNVPWITQLPQSQAKDVLRLKINAVTKSAEPCKLIGGNSCYMETIPRCKADIPPRGEGMIKVMKSLAAFQMKRLSNARLEDGSAAKFAAACPMLGANFFVFAAKKEIARRQAKLAAPAVEGVTDEALR